VRCRVHAEDALGAAMTNLGQPGPPNGAALQVLTTALRGALTMIPLAARNNGGSTGQAGPSVA
jgi:hypothetical protein